MKLVVLICYNKLCKNTEQKKLTVPYLYPILTLCGKITLTHLQHFFTDMGLKNFKILKVRRYYNILL